MNRFFYLTTVLLLVTLLVSCVEATPGPIEGMINPGDEIDGMTFTIDDEFDFSIERHAYCGFEPVEETDTTFTQACSASPGDHVFFGNCTGVGGDSPEDLDNAWQSLKSEFTFDGQAINLPAFGTLDFDVPDTDMKARAWNLKVENIAPGMHTIQCKWEEGGESGTTTLVFTVSEQQKTFPELSSDVPPGFLPYSSEKANTNYYLYVPGEYGVDPQQKWPLLLYLHGLDKLHSSMDVFKEGAPLDILENKPDFPFIVVAPKGKGGYEEYEIWSTDEKVNEVMALLDEVQGKVSVDPNRVYLTGESAGGNGTWVIGLHRLDRFAALVPVMGYYGWPFTVPENICDLVGVPV